ncbi:MAG: kinase [Bacteroidota bacterium]|nr:kinase [Bacteroidota bacterium]
MKRIALFENSSKPEAFKVAQYAAGKLIELKAECIATPELTSKFPADLRAQIKQFQLCDFEKSADAMISFGGDGTILSAARNLIKTGIPIMGVNVGKLGFLAEFSVEELDMRLESLMNGNYRLVDRTVIETELEGEIIYALNDFVIEKKDSSRMITLQAFANKHYIGDYRADGIILTTPTGSTAYSLSCGGPIIAPATQVICITPICPHSLTIRPLVIPDTSEIQFKLFSMVGEANLVADGQTAGTLHNEDSVTFRMSEYKVKLIKPKESTYYDLLRAKLLWAANAVDMNIGRK